MKYQNVKQKSATPFVSQSPLNLLQQDICLPAAILKHRALQHNLQWMQAFANRHGVQLAPHGKTSMTPWLFQQQLAAGAWGITVATPYQAQVAVEAGAKKLILANQLVGKANMALIASLLSQGVELYVCIDHADNATTLSAFFSGGKPALTRTFGARYAGGALRLPHNRRSHRLGTAYRHLTGA
ncbi:hypothetical protein [Alishewanella longhuensis]